MKKTKTLKELYKLVNPKDLDEVLPQAFALVREAAFRTLNQRHYNQFISPLAEKAYQGNYSKLYQGTLFQTLRRCSF